MAHDHVPNFVGASDNDLAVPSKSARPHRVKIMPEAYNWCSFAYISDTIFIDAIFLEELDETYVRKNSRGDTDYLSQYNWPKS
jgi:hypothetical protein